MSKVVLREGDVVYVQEDGEPNPAQFVSVSGIDWLQLAQQKDRLVKLIHADADDILWGIVHLIDAIQDQAVEDGLPVVHGYNAEVWNEEHPQ